MTTHMQPVRHTLSTMVIIIAHVTSQTDIIHQGYYDYTYATSQTEPIHQGYYDYTCNQSYYDYTRYQLL